MTRAITYLTLLVFAVGCSGEPMRPSPLTHEQAQSRAETLLRETSANLNPRPELERIDYWETPTPCEFSADGIAQRFMISRAYWLRKLPTSAYMSIAEQIKTRWQDLGHAITATGDSSAGHPDLVGKSRPDDFTLALAWTEGDGLYLAATSPCLWPDGKAPSPAG
ncbi:hypothetical protein [Nonomuraea cavernae]|uniref:hypothetical protein n=1 Tax=Nonomuraea cavernae TaxID=2045107 RepID=UPI0033E33955